MGDTGHHEQLVAEMQRMQQQMLQMQQTIQQQQADHQAALLAAQQQQQQQQQAVPIGQRNLARDFPAQRSAIAPPACASQDFEIKPATIDLVQRKMFHGLPAEIPMEHIDCFEEICSLTRSNGVTPDFIKCLLFPFSLDGKASRWLKSLPAGSLTSWEQVRAAFLSHFYTKAKTAVLRNRITSFRQLTDELFCEAWDRFSDYRRECPHHGFDDDYILGVFYDGVDWEFRSAMNSASRGDFMTQTTAGAFELIENMAASSANKNQENDRSLKVNSVDTKWKDELTAKVDQLLKHNTGQVFIMEETTAEQIQNQNKQKLQGNQQAVPAAENSSQDELKVMMQQLLQNQQTQGVALNQVTIDINARMDSMFTELNEKYDNVNSHMRQIDVQLAQGAENVKRLQGMLPGNSGQNHRAEHCNAVEQLFDKPAPSAEQPGSSRIEPAPSAERPVSSRTAVSNESAQSPPVRVYVPKVPYPVDPISEEQLAGFRKMVRRLPEKISFEQACEIRPLHMFFRNCRETQEEIKALFTEALTPSPRVLPKVDDPGKFVFPCSIGGVEFKEALCDSGSSVNLVSRAIVDKLCSVDVEPSQVTLAFANSSTAVPYGTVRSIPVQVEGCVLHAEFEVVEMSKDHEFPLIFGRTFMATVGAIIDTPNKRVSFSNINKKVFYKAVPSRVNRLHAHSSSLVSVARSQAVLQQELGEKSEIKEVLDGDPHTYTKKISGNAKVKQKVQKKRVKGDPMMTLVPSMCDERSIEYEVKCKGISKPFSKVRVVLTHELKEKGDAAVKGLLSRVLKLNMSDCGACFKTGPAQPD